MESPPEAECRCPLQLCFTQTAGKRSSVDSSSRLPAGTAGRGLPQARPFFPRERLFRILCPDSDQRDGVQGLAISQRLVLFSEHSLAEPRVLETDSSANQPGRLEGPTREAPLRRGSRGRPRASAQGGGAAWPRPGRGREWAEKRANRAAEARAGKSINTPTLVG